MLHYKSSGDVGDSRRVSLSLGNGSMGNADVSGQNTANGQHALSDKRKAEISEVIVVVQLEWMRTKTALRCHVKGRSGADK